MTDLQALQQHFESPAIPKITSSRSKKVRTISAMGLSLTSRKQAEYYVEELRAVWTDLTETAILFTSGEYRNECALRAAECQAERRANREPAQGARFEVSEWVLGQGGDGPADPLSWLHGVLCFWPDQSSAGAHWVELPTGKARAAMGPEGVRWTST